MKFFPARSPESAGYEFSDWSQRRDLKVRFMERTTARFLTPDMFPVRPDFASSGTSFISLRPLLGPMAEVTAPDAEAVALVKPQFEAPREDVGEGGVVRNASVLGQLLEHISAKTPWNVLDASWSDIRGPKGNIEYLLYLSKRGNGADIDVERLVSDSHAAFA